MHSLPHFIFYTSITPQLPDVSLQESYVSQITWPSAAHTKAIGALSVCHADDVFAAQNLTCVRLLRLTPEYFVVFKSF